MSDLVEQNVLADEVDDDDDWQPISIPAEEDPTITEEDWKQIRRAEENIRNGKYIEFTYKQLHALMEVFAK